MISGFTSGDYQAVVFFADGHVDREMMYSEFEAVLDSFVPMPNYIGKTIQAVCLGINGQLKIVSAVFFTLSFDPAGNADRKWAVPLQQLIDQADAGPDLGGGAIRLCCRSQCPVDWHVQDLWDPDMSRQPNDFVLLRDLVARNRLGFKELPLDIDDIGQSAYGMPPLVGGNSQVAGGLMLPMDTELSDADKALAHSLITFIRKKVVLDNQEQLEQRERDFQLQQAALKTRYEDEINSLHVQNNEDLLEMQMRLTQSQESIDQERHVAESLRRQLQEQQQITENLRDTFHQQLAESRSGESDQLQLLKSNFESELEVRIQAINNEFQQMLEAKDVELAYRQEQQNILKEDVARLHGEHAQLINEAGEQFIMRLRDNNVTFMTYHPGAGNVSITLDDIGAYLENPMNFVASICKISEGSYRDWLEHYNNPACAAHSEAKGEPCGKKLRRVDIPAQFVSGRSNRCPLHWEFVADKDA
jgi:hypothetical protein